MQLLRSLFLVPLMAVIAFIFISCQESPTTTMAPENQAPQALNKFVLPIGATLESATFNIFVDVRNNKTVNLHNITAPWEEMVVNWENFGGFSPEIEGSFIADEYDVYESVDIKQLVQGWLNGTVPNYGIILDPGEQNYPRARYDSREASNKPYLEIVYLTIDGNVVTEKHDAIEDTYIYELTPARNYGTSTILYTGWQDANDLEKQTLIKFDIEPTPDGGCTLTPGYWKTHSIYGPAPYDDTWAQIDENTQFFLSGKSYYQVLWTSPRGNAYYNLSFHYIAAKLNFLNGASVPAEVQDAFDDATDLFNEYTPAQVAVFRGNNQVRAQFIKLAGILGDYNEGVIGPGHCDD